MPTPESNQPVSPEAKPKAARNPVIWGIELPPLWFYILFGTLMILSGFFGWRCSEPPIPNPGRGNVPRETPVENSIHRPR